MTQPKPEDTQENPNPAQDATGDQNAEIAAGLTEQDPLAPEENPSATTEETTKDTTQDGEADERTLITALQDQLDTANDKMVRAVAEVENIRKRAAKEREDARKYAVAGFSKDVLNVADNLRRALDAVPQELLESEPRLKNVIDGIEATERELLRAFEKNGIVKLEPAEGIFDPNQHEVMFEAPGTGKPAGTIIQLVEPGYMLEGRLLRPARVGVAKDEGNTPPPPSDPGGHIDTEA